MTANGRVVVEEALELVADGLEPFVVGALAGRLPDGQTWTTLLEQKDRAAGIEDPVYASGDVLPLLRLLTERFAQGGLLFERALPRMAGVHAAELRAVRDAWAQLQRFDEPDAFRAVDTAARLLRMVGAESLASRADELSAGLSPRRLPEATRIQPASGAPATRAEARRLRAESEAGRERAGSALPGPPPEPEPPEPVDDVVGAVRSSIAAQRGPRSLSALSDELVERFGPRAAADWDGHGTLVRLVLAAEPRAIVTGPAPGYLHPPGAEVPDGWDREPTQADAPDSLRRLRAVDARLPLMTWARIRETISMLLAVGPVDGGALRALTRKGIEARAREVVATAATRGQLVYIGHVLWLIGVLRDHHDEHAAVTLRSATAVVGDYMTEVALRAGVSPGQLRNDIETWVALEQREAPQLP